MPGDPLERLLEQWGSLPARQMASAFQPIAEDPPAVLDQTASLQVLGRPPRGAVEEAEPWTGSAPYGGYPADKDRERVVSGLTPAGTLLPDPVPVDMPPIAFPTRARASKELRSV